jgi:hypothetical protein
MLVSLRRLSTATSAAVKGAAAFGLPILRPGRFRQRLAATRMMAPDRPSADHTSTAGSAGPPRQLFAFDFDHTIADANSDTFILRRLPGGRLPPELKASYVDGHWTEYMRRVIGHMHDSDITAGELQEVIEQLPLVEGMARLLDALKSRSETGAFLVHICPDACCLC